MGVRSTFSHPTENVPCQRAVGGGYPWFRGSWLRLHSGGDVGAGLPMLSMEEAAGWPGGVSGRSGHKGLEVRAGVSRKDWQGW